MGVLEDRFLKEEKRRVEALAYTYNLIDREIKKASERRKVAMAYQAEALKTYDPEKDVLLQMINAQIAEWDRERNEKNKMADDQYYQKHRERKKAKQKEYYEKNKDRLLKKKRDKYKRGAINE